ncbi:4-oxalocrotonate tautomerase family protein [Paraglaciecola aquimarina]|uniref:Tautomerase n=1 Tax=Paraglaciecola algarum TaxID=3050085 RepID=A0ABS9D7S1_9ALTE|nr:4-oxalocrotonate tautomerase family protein [Paraglaciecola sp. G1-23]MCF2948052.1 4-oxalocrotonate tautomerase family protein [Paraglaciecola sp. G1-23]
MPYVNIKVTDEGVTMQQKQQLVTGVTQLLSDILNKEPKTTFVVIDEIGLDNWGIGHDLVSDLRQKTNQ